LPGGRALSDYQELTSTYFLIITKAGRTEEFSFHPALTLQRLWNRHVAIHHPTPPLGGGERPRLPSAQVGPVTQAIRAMRAAEVNAGNLGMSDLDRQRIHEVFIGRRA
jgi:hypothetical protein